MLSKRVESTEVNRSTRLHVRMGTRHVVEKTQQIDFR